MRPKQAVSTPTWNGRFVMYTLVLTGDWWVYRAGGFTTFRQ